METQILALQAITNLKQQDQHQPPLILSKKQQHQQPAISNKNQQQHQEQQKYHQGNQKNSRTTNISFKIFDTSTNFENSMFKLHQHYHHNKNNNKCSTNKKHNNASTT